MGLNISEIIPRRNVDVAELRGKIIAIDAYNTLYQFLTSIRQVDGTPLKDSSGKITSHLSGLFYRNISLLLEGIKLVYVFDGVPPELKRGEIEKRKEAKAFAQVKYDEARRIEDIDGMRKYSARTVKLTDDIIRESKELLIAMGIPVIEAPSEGEAEAASLANKGLVWASASQDYDSLLYATPFLIRNLTLARRRKTASGMYIDIKPELVEFKRVLNRLDIDRDQLICLAILVGTDYNPGGVKGLGQKRALGIVQRYKFPFEIFKHVEKNFEFIFDWQEIYKLFHEYETANLDEIEFPELDKEKIKEILSSHDFSESRIDSALLKLDKVTELKKQKGLGEFF